MAVAFVLVIVGLLNLRPHRHDVDDLGLPGRPPTFRAFGVGLVHGLAGSAAVALLVLATIEDPRWACAYLLVFGLGTLLGMAAISTGFAFPVALASERWPGARRMIRLSTGALSLVFGAWLVWQIGWHDGLFLASGATH
jgi:high-affinity nickel-transport protein